MTTPTSAEREAFEAAVRKITMAGPGPLERDGDSYESYAVSVYWEFWQARAAMQTAEPVLKAIREACDIAMRHCIEARVPESGHFGEIAQGLSWALDQLAAPDRAPSTATNSCARCGKPLHADSIHTCTPPDHAPSAALIGAGARMSNIIYNLAQKPGYTLDNVDLSLFDGVRKEWDHWLTEYRRAPSTDPKFDEAEFDKMVERGTKVWGQVPDDWLEKQRGTAPSTDSAADGVIDSEAVFKASADSVNRTWNAGYWAGQKDCGADALREAAGKLIKARGRYHTEKNYAALVAAYDAMQSKAAQ